MKNRVSILNLQLASWRKQKHLTQAEIAELLGISLKTYWNYESGRSIPPVSAFLALEQILDVPICTLYESFQDYNAYIPLLNLSVNKE